jgi:DNA helicase HerA-like ATPase
MENGVLIGYKLDDKSLVYFTPENTQFCNNKSINFIGDSGSGKSLAVKLLIKRSLAEIEDCEQSPKAKFIILDSTLLGWEFFTAYMGGEIYNSPESFKNLVLFKKNISLVNFHSIEKNKTLTNLYLENIFLQIENAVRELDSSIYLVIDEAWKLIYEEENPLSKKLISKLARTGRAMNLGLWTISQKPSDLTRDIHSSAASSFIFQCKENTDKAELNSHLNLNERELKLLESQEIKDRGTALLKTSKFSGLIKFKADQDELILTNSSAEVVRERQLIFNEVKAANLKDSSHASFLDNMSIARHTLEKMQEKNIWS